MAHILFTSGPMAQRSITLQGEMTLGRAAAAEIHIDDPAASGRHARMVVTPSGEVVLTDLQSANGTLVNGKTVTRVTLREGDMIEIGESRFTVHVGPPAAAPRPAARLVSLGAGGVGAGFSRAAAGAAGRATGRPLQPPAHRVGLALG